VSKRRSRRTSRQDGRDAVDIARRSLPRPDQLLDLLSPRSSVFRDELLPGDPLPDLFEDRRFFYPAPPFEALYEPARRSMGLPARVVAAPPSKSRQRSSWRALDPFRDLPHRVAFEAPRTVTVCQRRQQRKEVLHAKGTAGGSVRKFKPRRRSEFSTVSCRRK